MGLPLAARYSGLPSCGVVCPAGRALADGPLAMTFVMDAYSGLLFFGSLFFALWIVTRELSHSTPALGTCPLHPNMDTCSHRKSKEK
jgi:hypothetical protein